MAKKLKELKKEHSVFNEKLKSLFKDLKKEKDSKKRSDIFHRIEQTMNEMNGIRSAISAYIKKHL
ncbi:MAG: hypothetical protein EKK37_01460 [Sphingobacteriales bacterium]|nr:MAG: hypothetical protein EKK37_01460 [Sphingobacteriales bacterium]